MSKTKNLSQGSLQCLKLILNRFYQQGDPLKSDILTILNASKSDVIHHDWAFYLEVFCSDLERNLMLSGLLDDFNKVLISPRILQVDCDSLDFIIQLKSFVNFIFTNSSSIRSNFLGSYNKFLALNELMIDLYMNQLIKNRLSS